MEYFAAIFKSDCRTSFEASLSAINTRVTTEMNDELLVEFKADEVAQAINQMHPTVPDFLPKILGFGWV